MLLREADRVVGLTRQLAGCFADCRSQKRVEHPVRQLVGQRLFGLGYEDLNDHDKLRDDSLLALGCADLTGENRVRERDRGHPLAGSKTLNRLGVPGEPDRYKKADTKKMDDLMVDLFLEAHSSPPKEIFLDFDATDAAPFAVSAVPPPPPPESRIAGHWTGMFALAAVRRRSRPQPRAFVFRSGKGA